MKAEYLLKKYQPVYKEEGWTMIDKLKIKECKKFLNSYENKTKYPKIHAMIFHYVDCYDNNKSQYLIEDKRK